MAESVLAKLAIDISANTAQLKSGLAQASTSFDSFTKTIASANKVLAGFGIGFGLLQVKGAFEAIVGTIATFEHTMSEVKAITQATQDEFDALRESALQLGASTKFTATEVGQLQVAYGRLGFTTSEILAATKATLDLSAATGEDLAKSADVAGSTVRAFGLTADETQRVVDVMASSFNKSALGLDNFAEAMKYVAPVAAAAGASIEETTALLGVLADAGIRGSTAGTSLRKIFTDISKDGRPLRDRLAELSKAGLTFSGAMDEVGRTAQSSLLVLTKNVQKIDDLSFAFRQAGGEAAKTAAIMQDDLTGDFTKLTSAIDGLVLAFSGTTSVFREFVQALTSIVSAVKSFVDSTSGSGDFIKKNFIDPLTAPIRTLGALADAINGTTEAVDIAAGAQKAFRNFAASNGYKDLAKAAEDYTDSLYKAIIAEQINLDNLKLLNAADGNGAFEKDIKGSEKLISLLWQSIAALGIYKKAKEDAAVVPLVPSGIIQSLEDQIKKQEELKKASRNTGDIAAYNDVIKALREELDVLNASSAKTTQFFKDLEKGLNPSILPKSDTGFNRQFNRDEIPDFVPAVDGLTVIQEHLEKVNKSLGENQKTWANWRKGIQHENELAALSTIDMGNIVAGGFSTLGEVIGQAISGTEDFGKGIIKALAAFARQFGEILISAGVAALALKTLVVNPVTAIAAGVALVAVGTAAAAAVKGSQRSNLGSSGNTGVSRDLRSSQTLNISIDGRIDGRDIVFQYDNNKRLDGSRKVGG